MKVYIGHEGSFVHVSTFGNRDLHIWVGPFGVHLFWPDLHKIRPDFCGAWR